MVALVMSQHDIHCKEDTEYQSTCFNIMVLSCQYMNSNETFSKRKDKFTSVCETHPDAYNMYFFTFELNMQ